MSAPRAAVILGACAALAACGGGGPAGPAPVPRATATPAPTGLAAGESLAFLSGADSRPLPGATVAVGGRTYTSDAEGRVVLAQAAGFGGPLDVTAPEVLDRQATLRAGGERTFILWPRATRSGIDEGYTAFLVYGDAAGSSPMSRLPDQALVALVPSPDLLADDLSHSMHLAAVERVNEVGAGLARFVLARERPASGIVFESRLDPGDAACAGGRLRAQVTWTQRNYEITGGRILFCSREASRTGTVLHELGHTLGFDHSPNPNDVMFGTFVRGRSDVFSERESLTLALMMRRRPGNRFPDRDPDRASAGAGSGERSVSCP